MMDARQIKSNIVYSAIAIIVLILGFVLYAPLINQLKFKSSETWALEKELLKARNIVTSMKTMGSKLQLISEDNLPVATDALMKQGGRYHIDFISTSLKEPAREKAYVMLPIDIFLESGYSELSDFLGSLANMANSVVKVSEFEVVASMNNPSKLKTRLTLNMYVLR